MNMLIFIQLGGPCGPPDIMANVPMKWPNSARRPAPRLTRQRGICIQTLAVIRLGGPYGPPDIKVNVPRKRFISPLVLNPRHIWRRGARVSLAARGGPQGPPEMLTTVYECVLLLTTTHDSLLSTTHYSLLLTSHYSLPLTIAPPTNAY